MRVLIQRAAESSVEVNNQIIGHISAGLCVFLGIEDSDSDEDIDWLCNKIVNLRIFNDNEGKMNLSVSEIQGEILLISQFTLHASTKKGNRPSFIKSAKPEYAEIMYNRFIVKLESIFNKKIERGSFGANMKVSIVNDGPVTIWMDSANRE